MNLISILTAILTLIAGIGVFLVACTMMSSNLESAASRRLKQLFTKTGNENYHRSVHNVTTLDNSNRELFEKTERQLNFLNHELVHYALLLSENQLNSFDHQYLISTIRTVSDLERIGDYAKNIIEYADSLRQQQINFSEYALKEIKQVDQLISALYDATIQAYHKMDMTSLGLANQIEDEVDQLTDEMERNHIQRLALGICKPQAGTEYISLAQNSERVADHLINVAKTIRDLQ